MPQLSDPSSEQPTLPGILNARMMNSHPQRTKQACFKARGYFLAAVHRVICLRFDSDRYRIRKDRLMLVSEITAAVRSGLEK